MSKRPRLTNKRFQAINRDLKTPGSQIKAIAKTHGVSVETVRTVKRAKTWPRFEAMKKLRNEMRAVTPHAPIKAVVVQQSLNPTEAKLDKITQAPANQIRPNPSEEIKVVTVGEWEAMNRKLGQLYVRLERLATKTSKRWWKRG
jgi:transposase-like protein